VSCVALLDQIRDAAAWFFESGPAGCLLTHEIGSTPRIGLAGAPDACLLRKGSSCQSADRTRLATSTIPEARNHRSVFGGFSSSSCSDLHSVTS
jgi:hypothetical protein